MSSLSLFTKIVFVLAPLVLTLVTLAGVVWVRSRDVRLADVPQRVLYAAVRGMPVIRSEWGAAMLAELDRLGGSAARWRFALGCLLVALFPPAQGQWFFANVLQRLASNLGMLSVILPPLGLPLLLLSAIGAENFTTTDDFFNGELVPGLVGTSIVLSLILMAAGVPLGIAGLLRRERHRWLSVMGSVSSVAIVGYMMLVQHLAMQNLR